jgi:hypothetical protein
MSQRKKNIEIIQSNIRSLFDSDVNKIYQKICESLCPGPSELVVIRAKKIKYVEENLELVDDATLDESRMIIIVATETEEEKKERIMVETEEKRKRDALESGDKMKRIALEICNKLLVTIGAPEISELCEFQKISRKKLMTDECKKIITDYVDYVFDNGFEKANFTSYVKTLKGSHVAFLRTVLRSIGYDLCGINVTKTSEHGRKTHVYYDIKLKN